MFSSQEVLIGFLVALIAATPGIVAVIAQRRTAKDTHTINQASMVVQSYESLCARLEQEIELKMQQVATLRQRQSQVEELLDKWATARDTLRERVTKLETEREELLDRVTKLEEEREALRSELRTLRAQRSGV